MLSMGANLMSRISRLVERKRQQVTVGVQAAIIDTSEQVLLVRHTYRPGWHFPGGGLERGETAVEALMRELREEVSVTLTGEPRLFGIFSHFDVFPGDHIVLYIVREFAWQETQRSSPFEIAERRFFRMDALPAETNPGTRRRIEEIRHGSLPAVSW